MRTYFKNAWKRLPTAIPEVLAKRAIFGKRKTKDGNGLPVIKRGGMAWGLKSYLPLYQVGEDASTMDAHREWLHIQHNQSSAKRDQRIIRKLMDLTFPHRRNLLIREMATIRSDWFVPIIARWNPGNLNIFLSPFSYLPSKN